MAKRLPKKILLDFNMEKQKEYAWCWAAVGTSSALYYKPSSGWTQCKIVEDTLKPDSVNCCSDPSSMVCDRPFALLNDSHKGALVTAHIQSSYVDGEFTTEELMTDLSKGQLVAYRLEIGLKDTIRLSSTQSISKFFHFVVIAGYKLHGKEVHKKNLMVYVYDPFSLDEGYSVMSYHTFLNNYKCHGGAVPTPNSSKSDKTTYARVTHSFHTSV
ncbi:MAG: hypothetical protein ACI9IP_002788 [Arcticibacterium sp.]|jgi:hypothetical protein